MNTEQNNWAEHRRLVVMLAFASGVFLCLGVFARADGNDVPGGVAGQATLEVEKRQHLVKAAQTLFSAGSVAYADGSFGEAMDNYKAAFETVPPVPAVEEQRRAFFRRYQLASLRFAEVKMEEARWQEAVDVLSDVMATARDHGIPVAMIDPEVRKTLTDLKDRDDRYNQATSPRHLADMESVQAKLVLAKGYLELGDYDRAERSYNEVLNIDPYNTAARRGMENVERHRLDYYDQAYSHTRSKKLREVAAGWESPVPMILAPGEGVGSLSETAVGGSIAISEKLRRIVIPRVEFSDARLIDVLEFLSQKSVELDSAETDPTRRGVNIVVDSSGAVDGTDLSQLPLSVRLSNIPLEAALQYVTQQVDMKFRVDEFAVSVIPQSAAVSTGLQTQNFVVPPGFITAEEGGGAADANNDPFAQDTGIERGIQIRRISAQDFLEKNGVTFPEGATARFIPSTSTLVVRNTAEELINITNLVQSAKAAGDKMVKVTIKMINVEDEFLRQAGLDFLLGPSNFGNTPRVFFGGGTDGNATNQTLPVDYPFVSPAGIPIGTNPVTSGLRLGDLGTNQSVQDIINRANPGTSTGKPPGVFSLSGPFTDPQFQMVLRLLSQHKGTDVQANNHVLVRPGQIAKIEQVREFIYPTEYDPPELPNEIGGFADDGNTRFVGPFSGIFPVTPATPTAFEMRRLGSVIEVEPTVGADNQTISLNVAADFSDFIGFVNYGIPIRNSFFRQADGTPPILTENRILMPVIEAVKETTNVSVWDGQTIAIGGLVSESVTSSEDKIPFVGDLPVVGRAFRSETKDSTKRALVIFVSVLLVDPGGNPINAKFEDPELITRQDLPPREYPVVSPPSGMVYPAK